jgi:thiamine biosynthesis protein ThiS
MIIIQFNSQTVELKETCNLNEVLLLHGYTETRFAIAVNRKFIPKLHYHNYVIQAGDHIEVITPMQGG